MVLELIILGGVVYYYCKKNKENKAKKEALAQGQPWRNKDGSVTYPPGYPGLPPYTVGDYKQQFETHTESERRDQAQREGYVYTDAPAPHPTTVNEKAPLVIETREKI